MYTPAVTMVAAWISADTGVGPSIASGSQTCTGETAPTCPGLRSDEEQQRGCAQDAEPENLGREHDAPRRAVHVREAHRAGDGEQQQNADYEGRVADAVHDEGLLSNT